MIGSKQSKYMYKIAQTSQLLCFKAVPSPVLTFNSGISKFTNYMLARERTHDMCSERLDDQPG